MKMTVSIYGEESMNSMPNEMNRELLDFSAVAIFAINPEHEVIYWNNSCESLTGYKAAEMLGTGNHWQPFYSRQRPCLSDIVISGELGRLPDLYEKYSRSVLIPNGLHAEGWYDNLGGKRRYIIFDATPIFNRAGELIAATETLQDITDKKLLDEKKGALLAHLQQVVEKSQALEGFISICASCKDVRQAEGDWLSIEKYISERTGSRFSHGLCPGCAAKLYPDIFKKINAGNKAGQ